MNEILMNMQELIVPCSYRLSGGNPFFLKYV